MHCPYCKNPDTQVLDTRLVSSHCLRRRRRCEACNRRFATTEVIERKMPIIIKKNQARVTYDDGKLRRSFSLALNKRPVDILKVEAAIADIEEKMITANRDEIDTKTIGEWVMMALEQIDQVAYIRYVSVYRSFNSIDEFKTLITHTEKR